MKKTNRAAAVGMGMFCALVTWASSPVPYTYDFTTTPTGVLATIEIDTETDLLYSILKNPNLLSNDWNSVETDFPGTGSTEVFTDLTPLASPAYFYTVTTTAAPPANILVNGDFEAGTPTTDRSPTFDCPPWVWHNHNNNNNAWLTDGTLDPIIGAGNQALEFRWGVTYIYQEFAATEDRTYLFSIDALNPGTTNNGMTAQILAEWYDASSNIIGSAVLIDESDNATDPLGEWFELSGSVVAPAGAATGRIVLMCSKNGATEHYFFDNAYVALLPLGASVASSDWTTFGSATRVAAAQYAGLYAVADDNSIQLNRIDESIVGTTTVSNINGMAFTSSGRQLFVSTPTAVKAYNVGTGALRDFATGLSLGSDKLGIAHFKGELFVGTAGGDILRYDAQLDDLTGSYNGLVNVGAAVRAIAVDIQDEMLYVVTPNDLYSLNPSNSVLTQIATLSNIVDISFGRTYGGNGHGGLAILQDTGAEQIVHLVPTTQLQAGGSVTPTPYYSTTASMPSLAMTACGRMLAAGSTPQMLSETTDTRMGFMEWVADEFDQNILAVKTLCWQDSGNVTGVVNNAVKKNGSGRGLVGSCDAAYWVVNQLIMADEINDDPEAQGLVREIVKRHATLEVNTDGQWYHWYNVDTGDLHAWELPDPETSAYSTMKAVHMAIRAKKYYPNDTEIVDAANTIIGRLRNQRDYVREFGSFASPADNLGPVIGGHRPAPYQEIHLYSELMAATEPMNENAYLDYWRDRDDHTYDYTMPEEPIVRTRMAGFWRMYDQSTIAHCRGSEDWKQEFKNFYALFAGWTDDNAPEHLTAFSAGPNPDGYNADKYDNHPHTINSFGTVMGFGLHGDTVPVVGAYFAYRDGRRQLMEGSANYADPSMLVRISYEQPSWVCPNISPTDHQYAGYALGELLKPGSVENTIALHTYIEPNWHTETSGDKTIDFSRLIKRQVWGTTDGTNWESLGYQHSPYTVASSSPYLDFKVTGAEGELLSASATGTNEETFDVNDDFDGTLYIIRAVTSESGPLRARWYNGTALLSTQTGTSTLLEAVKPTGATDLKVDLSGDVFDQVSVVLDGLPELFTNHDFELGNLTGWNKYSSDSANINGANAADSRLGGARALELTANAGTPDGKYAQVLHTFDISGDPVDTHYVLEFDALSENLQGSSLRIFTTVPDCDYDEINDIWNDRVDYFDTFERADDRTVLSAGLRKRNAQHLELQVRIRLRRDDSSAVTADERVLIDNLRLLKMKP